MRKLYSIITILALMLFGASSVFGAAVLTKTVELSEEITSTGYVRVVVKFTDKFAGKDIGIILHEEQASVSWNAGIGIMGFFRGAPAPGDGSVPQAMGYNETKWGTENVKDLAIGKEIAVWFKVDIANKTHDLSVQMKGETEVTKVYEGFVSRASAKGQPCSKAKYCSVFWNDAGGINSEGCVEIVSDPVIVSSIEPYFTASSVKDFQEEDVISIYPTAVEDVLNISSKEDIASVKIYSIAGKQVLKETTETRISLSGLKKGIYIVEAKTVNNHVVCQKIIKK